MLIKQSQMQFQLPQQMLQLRPTLHDQQQKQLPQQMQLQRQMLHKQQQN
jgi:hypothetical protein